MHKSSFKTQELLRWRGDNKEKQENSRSRNERLSEYTIERVVTEAKRDLQCDFWFVRHGDEPEYKCANEEHGNTEEDSNQENAAARETLLGLHFRPFLFQDSSRSPGSIVPSLLVSCTSTSSTGVRKHSSWAWLGSRGHVERSGTRAAVLEVLVHGRCHRTLPRRGSREALRQRVYIMRCGFARGRLHEVNWMSVSRRRQWRRWYQARFRVERGPHSSVSRHRALSLLLYAMVVVVTVTNSTRATTLDQQRTKLFLLFLNFVCHSRGAVLTSSSVEERRKTWQSNLGKADTGIAASSTQSFEEKHHASSSSTHAETSELQTAG